MTDEAVQCRAEGCGRTLTDELSRQVGIGPVCRKRMGIVVTVRTRGPRERQQQPATRRRGDVPEQMVLDLDLEVAS